jgi:transposase
MRGAVSGPLAHSVELSSQLRRKLQQLARSPKTSQREALRAKIALHADEGLSNAEIARKLGCHVHTVRKWRGRVAEVPDVLMLQDEYRSGRPPRIPLEVHYEVIKLACTRPGDSKVPFEQVWTIHLLATTVTEQTGVCISKTEVGRILQGACLQPHRVRMWLHSPDPDFRPKVAAICELYLQPPEGATVLCVDEKPGMQALEHRVPLKPCGIAQPARKEFEYRRKGTRTLIASFNIRTGEVLGACGPTRRADDLLAFMDQVAARYPEGPVYIIWDNLNIHYGPRWREFNKRHGERFHFVYTPLHASWVNQIEMWFSILARRVLKHASFRSVDELATRVLAFIDDWNRKQAHPFRWKFRGNFRSVLPSHAA